ncbi:hypothetical protein [Limnoglobus roseus]|uniref:Recombinase family protein n=1 Tax=Limnoglobus roseus TaxID=2598579 RepID=A0A5C1ADE5_9BACT|nr:hypothetical protein [Limnoglobus roseus]QEL17379.1 recombinase family protein [Limnoglobus roseus]
MLLPAEARPLILAFLPVFTHPTYTRFVTMIAAAVLTTGRRTVTVRWVGGGVTRHDLVRPVHTYERLGDLPRLRERIRELMAAGLRSGLIAARLNAEGFHSPKGDQRFTADRVRQIVCRLGLRPRRSSLPADAQALERHEAWMTDLAEELAIPVPTLMAWCKRGWVEARKVEAVVLRWVVWADDAEKARLKRLDGGRPSGLRHPYPVDLTTPRRLRDKNVVAD